MSAQSVLELEWPDESEPRVRAVVMVEPLERLSALAEACAEILPRDMTVHECIAVVERITLVQTQLAGLKSAALVRIGELQKPSVGEGSEPVPLGSVKIPGTHRTVFDLVEQGGGQSRETSRKEIQRAEAIAGLYPLFGQAIRAGKISAEYLDVLTRTIRDPGLKERASRGEAELLARALREPLSVFSKSVRAWMVTNAPVAAEVTARRQAKKESFRIFKDDDGVTVHGWFTSINGLVVERAIRAMIGVPSREDTRSQDQRQAQALLDLVNVGAGDGADAGGVRDGGDVMNGSGGGVRNTDFTVRKQGATPAVGTPRFQISVHVPLETLVQTQRAIEKGCQNLKELERQHSGVEGEERRNTNEAEGSGECQSSCYEVGTGLGKRGSCLTGRGAVIKELGTVLSTIRAGTDPNMLDGFPSATLEDGTPLVPSKLSQLLCDSSLVRIVMSARGEPIDASHAQRLFSTTQTRAIHARDRSCRFPGCDRGVSMSQIHHAQQWEKGGKTIMDNAVLLCWHHHEVIHRDEITIAHHAGGFAFYRPSGSLIGVRAHESRTE